MPNVRYQPWSSQLISTSMLICTNLPNLAEVGGSSGSPCRWSKHGTRKKNCQEAQEWRYVSACRCGVPACLPPWGSDFAQKVCHFSNLSGPVHLWFLPTPSKMPRTLVIPAHPLRDAPHTCVLTQKLDKMTKDGQQSHEVLLQFVTSNLPVEALWPSHEPRFFHMERKHEPRYALWDEDPTC